MKKARQAAVPACRACPPAPLRRALGAVWPRPPVSAVGAGGASGCVLGWPSGRLV